MGKNSWKWCFRAFFFHMVIVKHETHHLHDFVVKFVIFNVNRVNFYQEQCTVILIQRKRRSKNRLGAETIAALLLLLCSCYALPRRPCVLCERSHPLTWAPKKIRAAYVLLTPAVWNRRQNHRWIACDNERDIASLVSDLRLCVLNASPFENRWWRFTANQGASFTDEMCMTIAWDISPRPTQKLRSFSLKSQSDASKLSWSYENWL